MTQPSRPRAAPGARGPRRAGGPPHAETSLLAQSAALLERVLAFDAPADARVSEHFRQHRALGPRERHALAETTYEVLRRLPWYDRWAGTTPRAGRARRLALLAWQGEARSLAAASEAEREWRVRTLAEAAEAARDDDGERIAQWPAWLATRLADDLARRRALAPASPALRAELGALAGALLEPAPLDLRVNLLKTTRDAVAAALAADGIAARPTPHSPWGLRLEGKPALQRWPLFVDGAIEVQDEGSQLIALLLGARRGEMVVDFCAGAGGKTLALGAAMRSTGRLYAFDVAAHRLAALTPRLARSGLSNVHPVQIAHERDARVKRLAGKFDRVLVDAPCSGLGTLRRNPDLKWRQQPADVAELVQRQRAILDAAATLVAPGGRLVYATCSLLDDENEGVATAFAQARPDFVALPAATLLEKAGVAQAASLDEQGALRLWPHRHGSDGFFARAWQRAS